VYKLAGTAAVLVLGGAVLVVNDENGVPLVPPTLLLNIKQVYKLAGTAAVLVLGGAVLVVNDENGVPLVPPTSLLLLVL
jgi:hypothetical protein